MDDAAARDWDYVIVGSGAGGGTLAARLAESGMRVFLIEAGPDACSSPAPRLPDDYEVPAFHAHACENPAMSWNFHVRHYDDESRQRRDPKYEAQRRGVLYPRAAALGGCTAHNAMIFVLPHDSDWDGIAELTGDASWRASNMRHYVERLEACRHRPLRRALRRIGLDSTGHGWDGWLQTEKARPPESLADDALLRTVVGTARGFAGTLPLPVTSALRWLARGRGDPNARSWRRRPFTGLCYTPLSTRGARRIGARDRVIEAVAAHPDRLHVETDALATRVLFDDAGRATGVEYMKGARLYRAHVAPDSRPGELRQVRAMREVVLCGGAFNTPQLLMLSGVGPADRLRALGIPLRVDLPGVGSKLQDRYEVALNYRMREPWKALDGTDFAKGDAAWRRWSSSQAGIYSSNGVAMAIVRRSSQAGTEPDLFCMAMLARFDGYFTGFSEQIGAHRDRLSWIVLKAHTENRAGSVSLVSADPRDPPQVNFRYFDEGSDSQGKDLRAVVEGIRFVRRMTAPLIARGLIAEEILPGPSVDGDDALADYVRDHAWGHHASGSCAIGPREREGVLDGDFRVHGVSRLRVVDASAFPRIPGFFIASAVYLIAEKAADATLRDAPDCFSPPCDPPDFTSFPRRPAMDYTPETLMKMSQKELDELFVASPAGDIPDGDAQGTAIIAPGTRISDEVAGIVERFAWQGKTFDAKAGALKNRVLAFGVEAIVAKVYKAPSWLDGNECIVLDYSETSIVAKWIRDEIRLIGPGFYLGKVYWGKKRLIDFCLQF